MGPQLPPVFARLIGYLEAIATYSGMQDHFIDPILYIDPNPYGTYAQLPEELFANPFTQAHSLSFSDTCWHRPTH